MLFARSTFDDVLSRLLAGELLPGQVTAHHERPSAPARFGDFPPGLHPTLLDALRARGIARPYAHQAEAIAAIQGGKDLVLTTPTASGKTLCFNVPVLDRVLHEPDARALYIFPTKALSADQYAGLHGLVEAIEAAHTARGQATPDIKTFTFDGDTPNDARRAIRDHGHIVITNPDMLHAAVLPQHTKWVKLFENLRYVIIDELHTYRGIFGSNVAQLLRRLVRICRFHGSDPRFIACSATIENPVELAGRLTGIEPQKFHLVARSDAPLGEHHYVAYNPPVVNRQLQIRAGAVAGATAVAKALLLAGVPTIVFAGSRLHVELILKYLREALAAQHLDPELVQGYRGGYLPLHRRRIEAGLRAGTIRGVVATNALEVGIDIGTLQAAVIAGYPGSIASFRQQSGRAGRRADVADDAGRGPRAMTIYVAGSGSLDQYLVNRPDLLFEGAPEVARINPKNLFVLVDHAKCAAFELPFERGEAFGVIDASETEEVLRYLESHRIVHESAGRFHWTDRAYPANHVRLRGPNEENFIVIEIPTDRVLAEVDFRSAHTTLHEHAIYHVDSQHYQVERLDYDDHKAFVRKVDPDYYTTAMTYTKVSVLTEDGQRRQGPFRTVVGEVLVTRKFVGFKKIRFHTNEVIGYGEIHLPDLEMHTSATWVDVPGNMLEGLDPVSGADEARPRPSRDVLVDALSAVGHALKTVACAALMCAERDLGLAVEDDSPRPEDARARRFDPTLYLYDALPGGIGLAPEIHQRLGELCDDARTLGARCGCEQGCPQCSGPMPTYSPGLRAAARTLLDALCGAFGREAPALTGRALAPVLVRPAELAS